MKANKQGVWGEVFAARYMRDHGFDPVTGNFSCRFGEVDIITRKDGYMCYVEIKTRSKNAISEPKEAVGAEKQANLIATSEIFAKVYPHVEQARFDVCEVFLDDDMQVAKINYIENAFNG